MKQLDLFGQVIKEEYGYQVQKERLDTYNKEHCYQYEMRVELAESDKFYSGLSDEEINNLSCENFVFRNITSEHDKQRCVKFIERHEWLGTIAPFTTHWFIAEYKGLVGGVILLSEPYNRQKYFDCETYNDVERLISRGACVSWSPKNLASSFLMWCINWMVSNTKYRLFSAYSDPTAKELGTIYQACNFYYLGNKYGKNVRFYHPFIKGKIVNSRAFRDVSMYRYAASNLGIKWDESWADGNTMRWCNVPNEIETNLRKETIRIEHSSEKIDFPSKHKYVYLLGKDKRETRKLRRMFESNVKLYEYPKERGK